MKQSPWTTKSSTQKYKNPWIEVTEDIVIDDRNRELLYGVVKIIEGTCVLPLDDNGYVYLAKQFRYGLGDYSVEGPGGAIDEGEEPLTSAKRELMEELGISASNWINLGKLSALTGVINHTEHLFLARGFEPPTQIPKSDEETIELIRVSLEEAVQMVMNSEIVHSLSATLILKAKYYLENNK